MREDGDYISREAAIAFQDELAVLLCKDVVTGDVMSATKDADLVKYLLSIPAADVQPVVKATWKRIDFKPCGHDYECSSCGWKNDMATHFCPNCGADMRPKPSEEET